MIVIYWTLYMFISWLFAYFFTESRVKDISRLGYICFWNIWWISDQKVDPQNIWLFDSVSAYCHLILSVLFLSYFYLSLSLCVLVYFLTELMFQDGQVQIWGEKVFASFLSDVLIYYKDMITLLFNMSWFSFWDLWVFSWPPGGGSTQGTAVFVRGLLG